MGALKEALLLPLAMILVSSGAPESAAQPTGALPPGWVLHHEVGQVMDIAGVACSRDKAFVRGWHGRAAQWDGSRWTALPNVPSPQYGRKLWASQDGRLLTYAGDRLAELIGGAWRVHQLPEVPGELEGIWSLGPGQAYLAGRGRIVSVEGGSAKVSGAGTWRDLFGIWSPGDGPLWVSGQGGTVMSHDGQRWRRHDTKTAARLVGIWGTGADDLWAWAERDEVIHWDGRQWSQRSAGLKGWIKAVGGVRDQVYAVGDFGLARYSGSAWTVEITEAALGPGGHELVGLCATDRHIVVGDWSGDALIKAR